MTKKPCPKEFRDDVARVAPSHEPGVGVGSDRQGFRIHVTTPVHDDLCALVDEKGRTRHEFTATAFNEFWIGDITEPWAGEGKLYLCAFKDVFSTRIVGYSIDSRMKSRLAVTALNNAVARRGVVAGRVVHTDRGSQLRSWKLVGAINQPHMVGSMGQA